MHPPPNSELKQGCLPASRLHRVGEGVVICYQAFNFVFSCGSMGRGTEHRHLTQRFSCKIFRFLDIRTAIATSHKFPKKYNFLLLTFDWPVTLSLAKYILCIVPNGLNNSCKSDSLVSSDKFVTLIVADSSVKHKHVSVTQD